MRLKVFKMFVKLIESTTKKQQINNEFYSLDNIVLNLSKTISKTVEESVKTLVQLFKTLLNNEASFTVFDLSEYDPDFDFIDPPAMHYQHLVKALKAIYANSNELENYSYIGFRMAELERVFKSLRDDDDSKPISIIQKSDLSEREKQIVIRWAKEGRKENETLRNIVYQYNLVFGGGEFAKHPRRFFIESKGEKSSNYKKCELNKVLRAFDMKGIKFPVSGKTLEKLKPRKLND